MPLIESNPAQLQATTSTRHERGRETGEPQLCKISPTSSDVRIHHTNIRYPAVTSRIVMDSRESRRSSCGCIAGRRVSVVLGIGVAQYEMISKLAISWLLYLIAPLACKLSLEVSHHSYTPRLVIDAGFVGSLATNWITVIPIRLYRTGFASPKLRRSRDKLSRHNATTNISCHYRF